MSSLLPNDLALTAINDGAQIVASDHRNNYAAIQAAFNALRDALADGTAGQVVTVADATHIALALLADANIDPAAAIAYSKLNLAGGIVNADINASAAISLAKLAAGTNHTLLLSGASAVASLPAGSQYQLLQSGGASADPSWVAPGNVTTVVQATPANPTGTASVTPLMMGLSSGAALITPTTGRLFIGITGFANISGVGTVYLRYGQGPGPANGAAVTGTIVGNPGGVTFQTNAPFSLFGIVTGLAPRATTVWADLAVQGDGTHTATIGSPTIVVHEIL